MTQTSRSQQQVEPAQATRRSFVKTSTVAAAAAAWVPSAFPSSARAAGSDTIRVGLVGCGGRGNGALDNCLSAAEHLKLNLQIVAVADYFQDKANETGKKHGLSEDNCFGGPLGYREVMKTDADLVLLATTPNFRPVHLAAAVEAGKHVFAEKPIAVDPPGARKVLEAGEVAKANGQAIVAGTQRRHDGGYRRNAQAVADGAIGTIVGGNIYWCGGSLWLKTRKEGESDADYLIRNWVSFTEMSGDHIVEQHIHNLDVANWFIGRPPVSAFGLGGRARRKTGDQFDFFGIDYDYGEGCHIHSMCRQVSDCANRVTENLIGTEGRVWGGKRVARFDDQPIKAPSFETYGGPYVQEHVDLLDSIVKGQPLNEVRNVVEATLTGLMGRISAYTGQIVKWSDLTSDAESKWYDLTLSPSAIDFELGDVVAPTDDVYPVPGA